MIVMKRSQRSGASTNMANSSFQRGYEMKLEDLVMMQYIEELRKSMKSSPLQLKRSHEKAPDYFVDEAQLRKIYRRKRQSLTRSKDTSPSPFEQAASPSSSKGSSRRHSSPTVNGKRRAYRSEIPSQTTKIYPGNKKFLKRMQQERLRVRAFRNGQNHDYFYVVASSIEEILDECTRKMNLPSAARKLFLADGTLVTKEIKIYINCDVYVSCGEAFKNPDMNLEDNSAAMQNTKWTLTGLVLPQDKKRGKTKTAIMSDRLKSMLVAKNNRYMVFRNQEWTSNIYLVSRDVDELMELCTQKFKLESHCTAVYNWKGEQIIDLSTVPALIDCLQIKSQSKVFGPLWVTRGAEHFSPKGAYEYIRNAIHALTLRLNEVKKYGKKLDQRLQGNTNHGELGLTIAEYTIEQANFENVKNEQLKDKVKKGIATLQADLESISNLYEEEKQANEATYKLQHIPVMETSDRLLGAKGLRLKVHINGDDVDFKVIHFNVRQSGFGASNDRVVIEKLLDRCNEYFQKVGKNTISGFSLVPQRLFTRQGDEIKSVLDLEYDQDVWISYGEDFIPLNTRTLQFVLNKVVQGCTPDGMQFIGAEELGTFDEIDWQGGSQWEVLTELSSRELPTAMGDIGGQPKEIDRNSHYLRSKVSKNMILYPDISYDKKYRLDHKELWPPMAQQWIIHQDGHICCKSLTSLALTKLDHLITLEIPNQAETYSGYEVALRKYKSKDPNQIWCWSGDGNVYIKNEPELQLTLTNDCTVLSSRQGNLQFTLTLIPRLSRNLSRQRWGIKQEGFHSIGQFKYSVVENPEWSKRSLSWPSNADGQFNETFTWPMEGFIMPFAPSLKAKSGDINKTSIACRSIKVYRNGGNFNEISATIVIPKKSWTSPKVQGNSNSKNSFNSPTEETEFDAEMQTFLEKCTSKLELPFAARRVFDIQGKELLNLDAIEADETILYISCGENWVDPKSIKMETKKKELLTILMHDVDKLKYFCSLRHPADFVLDVIKPSASELITTQSSIRIGKSAITAKERDRLTKIYHGIMAEDDLDDEDYESYHQMSHARADERLEKLKKPWQLNSHPLLTDDEAVANHDSKMEVMRQIINMKSSEDTYKKIEKAYIAQQWLFTKQNFICCKSNPNIVLAADGELIPNASIILKKKDVTDITQRWIITEDGYILAKFNMKLGLTVTMPSLYQPKSATYDKATVTIQQVKSFDYGQGHQRWHHNPITQMIEAFSTDIFDKEITAAINASLCTFAVMGPIKIVQPGFTYIALTGNQELFLCDACGKAARGRRKFKRIEHPVAFACAMGDATNNTLKLPLTLKCLHGKVDLTTENAVQTKNYWESEVNDLRQATNVKVISQNIKQAPQVHHVKVLAYRNGRANKNEAAVISGSSITELLDLCTTRLGLPRSARRLYSRRGKLILDMNDLYREMKRKASLSKASLDRLEKTLEQTASDQENEIDQVAKSNTKMEMKNINTLQAALEKDGDNVEGNQQTNGENETYILNNQEPDLIANRHEIENGEEQQSQDNPDPNMENASEETNQTEEGADVFDQGSSNFDSNCNQAEAFSDNQLSRDQLVQNSENRNLVDSNSQLAQDTTNQDVEPNDDDPPELNENMQDLSIDDNQSRNAESINGRENDIENSEHSIIERERPEINANNDILSSVLTSTEGEDEEVFDFAELKLRPVPVWVSCGEPFINPADVISNQQNVKKNRDKISHAELLLQQTKHRLRQVRGQMQTGDESSVQTVSGSNKKSASSNRILEKRLSRNINKLQAHLEQEKASQLQSTTAITANKVNKSAEAMSRRLYLQHKTIRVAAYLNGTDPKKTTFIFGSTLDELLTDATGRLSIASAARKLYDGDGKIIKYFNDIQRDQLVCISCGEHYITLQEKLHNIEAKAQWVRSRRPDKERIKQSLIKASLISETTDKKN
ncbi:Doublecortin domain-containing protein 5 [Trichoplax sp. H2]|nr:Doublecortin domain-containing protein 5 [Trichoplax sp. H2]|eukprot:RDD44661.1 Doublecortin domain-containing protein 5 [Trichoplax sp. H2]